MTSFYKFNVNEAVAIRLAPVAPFECWYVSEQLETAGQHAYRIRSGTTERLVQESELIKLDDRLDCLLPFANAIKNDETRNALMFALCEAQHVEDRRNKPLAPVKRVGDLEKSISKTISCSNN